MFAMTVIIVGLLIGSHLHQDTKVEDLRVEITEREAFHRMESQQNDCKLNYNRCRDHKVWEDCYVRYEACFLSSFMEYCVATGDRSRSCEEVRRRL